jgi:hypothetical protein
MGSEISDAIVDVILPAARREKAVLELDIGWLMKAAVVVTWYEILRC